MKERNVNRPKTVEEWKEHLYEFTSHWEVGSPEHCAVSDFLNLQRLYSQFGKKQDDYLADVSGESALSQEKRESLDLLKIALLENTITHNRAKIPRYTDACVYLIATFQDLLGAAVGEAQAKFPNSPDKQNEHIKEIYKDALAHSFDRVTDAQYQGPNF